jgi:SPP1 gp7 family putative phage head morphogenesis protein
VCGLCGDINATHAYARPATGFVKLWPYAELGGDEATAYVRVGAHVALAPVRFAALVKGAAHRIDIPNQGLARHAAIRLAKGAPVDLLRYAATGPRGQLFQRVERIEALTAADAAAYPEARLVIGPSLVEKASSPWAAVDVRAVAHRLASGLVRADRHVSDPVLVKYLDRLAGKNWGDLAPRRRDEILAEGRDFLRSTVAGPLLPAWSREVKVTVDDLALKTRAAIKESYLPSLNLSLAQPDRSATQAVATQAGWFLRDSLGTRSQALTDKGRDIVTRGIASGLGRDDIGEQLAKELPDLWRGKGKQYASTVAAVAVGRARRASELESYVEIGVDYLEVVAMLDERTTDICRAMDGQVIPVSDAKELSDRAAAVTNPDDIYKVNPFLQTKRNDDGTKPLGTRLGTQIGTIERSGVGRPDDRGRTSFNMAGGQFIGAKVGAPPYHFNCRSTTIPRHDIVQVPRGYSARSLPDKSGHPSTTDAIKPAPVSVFPNPSKNRPVVTGSSNPLDDWPAPHLGGWDKKLAARVLPGTKAIATVEQWVASSVTNRAFKQAPKAWEGGLAALTNDAAVLPLENDSFIKVHALVDEEEIVTAALVSNPAALRRELVIKFLTPEGVKWARFNGISPFEYEAAVAPFRDAVARGDIPGTRAAAAKLVATGKRNGWLKTSKIAGKVTTPSTGRAVSGGRGLVPRVAGRAKPANAARVVQPEHIPPPEVPPPAAPAVKLVPPSTPTSEVAVTAEVYAARPDATDMVAAVKYGLPGYWRGAALTEEGTSIAPPWRRMQGMVSSDQFGATNMALTEKDRVVNSWVARDLKTIGHKFDQGSSTGVVRSILEAERERGQDVMRDWVVTDERGNAIFMRVNGAILKRMPEATYNKVIETAPYDLKNGNPVGFRADLVDPIETTGDVRKFYPKAEVDWSMRNFIPGVPLEEQVTRRVDSAVSEISERLQALGAAEPAQKAQAIREVILKDATTQRPSSVLQKIVVSPSGAESVGRQVTANITPRPIRPVVETDIVAYDKAVDLALAPCSDGLLCALQSRNLPLLVNSPSFTRAFFSGDGAAAPVGAMQITSKIALSKSAEQIVASAKETAKTDARYAARAWRHEMQHYVDTAGKNCSAARHAMKRQFTDGHVVKLVAKKRKGKLWGTGVPGRWVDDYDGKLYGQQQVALQRDIQYKKKRSADEWRAFVEVDEDDHVAGVEYATMGRQRIDDDEQLLKMWDIAPEQVAFIKAMLGGAFTPF